MFSIWKMYRFTVIIRLSSFLVNTAFLPIVKGAVSSPVFDWQKISPSESLNWVECYDGRECARLEVPLDYSDPNGDKAAVALLRIKANVSSDSKEYRGPVLFNPGGPGESGVAQVDDLGDKFQQILGKEYDIIGFDPRGVGATTPAVSIFPDEVERTYWGVGAPPVANSTPDALPRSFFRAHLFNDLVESRSKRAAQHVSTAVVARDMLAITKAHGRDRLQYWGFSYGTVLGATYAAMFPDNVERLIIDGVVDFDDYYAGSWSKNLFDTDKVLQFLYDHCASAGSACPLHANTTELVQERVESILESVRTNPVPVINGTEYGLIDYTMVKEGIFNTFYLPFARFPAAAQALAALESGDGRPALALFSNPLTKCDSPPPPLGTLEEAGTAVKCGDGVGAGDTLTDITHHFQYLSKFSVFADIWTEARVQCAGWKVQAKERFAGPFTLNTSFPLLIIGNTLDPVAPHVGAQKAANGFMGSVLLTINTPGHTSNAATSLCAQNIIRNYFQHGELPPNGTVCEIEDVLFQKEAASTLN